MRDVTMANLQRNVMEKPFVANTQPKLAFC